MFGYIIINKGEMKFKEFDVYQSYYCGLCQCLKKEYGLSGQISLSYDMTFLVMLLTSLYEPHNEESDTGCIAHPFQKHHTRSNEYTKYAADMNIILTYLKCRDDWEDDRKITRMAYGKLLEKSYNRVVKQYPEKARKIQQTMKEIKNGENKGEENLDKMSGLFGKIMGTILAYKDDEWKDELTKMGFFLGKFIYLMDAYEDVEEDIKNNDYNPMKRRFENPDFEEESRTILTMMMSECSGEFEKLPIIDNLEILRNILYSGVWYRYNMVSEKRKNDNQEKGMGISTDE